MARFSGERPGRGPGYDYDDSRHQVAYEAVAELVRGKVVVDAGSGDGAGTAVLSATAAHVTGLDHHRGSVVAASAAHGGDAVDFVHADLASPWPVEGADVVIAFQIIEHFVDDHAFVVNALAALAPGGVVVITTPNVATGFSENPWHVREYRAEELRAILGAHSDDVEIRGVHGNERVAEFDRRRRDEVDKWLRLDPWRLRDRLPRRVVELVFATLSTVVRRRASSGSRDVGSDTGEGGCAGPITVDDFEVRTGDLHACLDFFAVVRRTR